jgi:hypothetical protein
MERMLHQDLIFHAPVQGTETDRRSWEIAYGMEIERLTSPEVSAPKPLHHLGEHRRIEQILSRPRSLSISERWNTNWKGIHVRTAEIRVFQKS